jgi:hypothetical protein
LEYEVLPVAPAVSCCVVCAISCHSHRLCEVGSARLETTIGEDSAVAVYAKDGNNRLSNSSDNDVAARHICE